MASWRPQASILEVPGLDFGGSGLDFPRFWTSQTMPEGLSGWQTLCHQLVLHHWAVRGRKVAEILPSHGTSASNACASVSWRRWARCSRSGVAGGVPPLGAFNGIEICSFSKKNQTETKTNEKKKKKKTIKTKELGHRHLQLIR